MLPPLLRGGHPLDANITRRLDALFADESLAQDQCREVDYLARLAVDWSGERW